MASGATSKYALPYPQPADAPNIPADMQGLASALDGLIATAAQGAASARPAFGKAGRSYLATDTGLLSLDTGSAWLPLGIVNSSGALISKTVPGSAAVAGSSGLAADAGHTHSMDALTAPHAPYGYVVAGALTVRTVELIAPASMSVSGYEARLKSGSGGTCQLTLNGTAVSGSTSGSLSSTVAATSFTPISVTRGQVLALSVLTVGTSAADLTVMLDAAFTS